MRLYAARQGESRKLNAIIRHIIRRRKINRFLRLLTISLLAVFLSQITSATPLQGSTTAGSTVLAGAGDISTCDNNNDEATAKLLDNIPGTVFALGDNVYIDGNDSEFSNCYHPTWGRHKNRTKPVPGNHEYFTTDAAGYFTYFNNIPSYYAYDLGDWRIYALNSEIDVSPISAQVQWLKNDLAVNSRLCVLAYWHKPIWSSRYEDGSDSNYQTLWQTLHAAGAELVINGHIHNYERFKEMNAEGQAASPGLREIVVGTGGVNHDGYVTSLSTSEVLNASTYGVMKLTLNSTSYSWQFIPIAGQAFKDSGSTDCHQ
jgi:acid phosphatase type 7